MTDFRFLDFFCFIFVIEGTRRGSDKRSHLTVFASLHQECTIQRSIHIAYLYPFNQFSVIYRLTVEGIPHAVDITQAASISPLTHGPVMVRGRWVYHSHSRITLLGQLCSTPEPSGSPASFVARNPREGGRCVLPREGLYSCLSAFHSVGIDPYLFQKAKDL